MSLLHGFSELRRGDFSAAFEEVRKMIGVIVIKSKSYFFDASVGVPQSCVYQIPPILGVIYLFLCNIPLMLGNGSF